MTEPAFAPDDRDLLAALNSMCRLQWRRAWITTPFRFSGTSPIFKGEIVHLSPEGRGAVTWHWSLTAQGDEVSRNIGDTNGMAESAIVAAQRGEEAWFAAIKGSSLERRQDLRNAYATAKDPE